jgi:hypothetical protein
MFSKTGRILFALLFLCDADSATSFSIHGQPRRLVLMRHAAPGEVSEAETDSSKGTKLDFKGVFQVTSNPLPSLPDDKMTSFFENPTYWNLLVTAGGERPCEEISATESLLEDWKKACDVVGAQYPADNDVILSVITGGIDFPGLHLKNKAQIGVKLLQEPSPRYEFTLIGDERTVTGLAPVVWMFNKLTGAGAGDKNSDNTTTSSLSVISFEQGEDGKTTITADANISVTVKFPSALLKILPTNKEKAEETGGKAITKAVEKDLQASMKAFEEEYLNFMA